MRRSFTMAIAVGSLLVLLLTSEAVAATRTVRCDEGAPLQEAIDGASSGDTLIVMGECRGNFVVSDKDLTLKGGDRTATLHARGSGAALMVDYDDEARLRDAGSTVRLLSLTITGSGGDGPDGDGIHSWGRSLVLRDSVVTGNRGNGIGGDAGRVMLRNSVVKHNGGHGVGSAGHGHRVFVRDSMVRDNGATGLSGVQVDVRRSIVRDNGEAGIAAELGGGVSLRNSTVAGNQGAGVTSIRVDLYRAIVRGNHGGGVSGGWRGDETWLRIEQSTITDNQVDGDGGGIWCRGGCVVTDTVVKQNRATGEGGGIYLDGTFNGFPQPIHVAFDSVIIKGNRAGVAGGAIYNGSTARVALDGVTFESNVPNDCTGCLATRSEGPK